MENRLPDNFSDLVMKSIEKEIIKREKRENVIMYSAITCAGALLIAGIVYLFHKIHFPSLQNIISNTEVSISPMWIIIFFNTIIILSVFSYFTHKKELTQHE